MLKKVPELLLLLAINEVLPLLHLLKLQSLVLIYDSPLLLERKTLNLTGNRIGSRTLTRLPLH